jgi:glc operon protein GlcG
MSTPAPATTPPSYGLPITLAQAKIVMAAAEAEALKNGWPMVIAIVDSGANLVQLTRMENGQIGSLQIAQDKAQTAVKFKRQTKVFQDLIATGGGHLRLLAMSGVAPLEGGLPIFHEGKIIGGIGVSGMSSNQDQQVGEAGLAALAAGS